MGKRENVESMKNVQNPLAAREAVQTIVKRFYRRGQHPNSQRNLRPVRKGQVLNPNGRRGNSRLENLLPTFTYFDNPQWRKAVREMDKVSKMFLRGYAEHCGVTPARAKKFLARQGLW